MNSGVKTLNFELRIGCPILKLKKFEIETLLCNQFLMGPHLSNPSFMENDNSISMLDGGETVSNNDRCSPFEQSCQTLLD